MAEAVATTNELATTESSEGDNNAQAAAPSQQLLPGMNNLGVAKQLGLMIGLAASVALGVFLVIWGSEPEMRPLGQTDAATAMEIISYLDKNNIAYSLDRHGMIQVPQTDYQRVQMEINAQGFNLQQDSSDAILNKDTGFGVSQRLEKARLQRSQELKLAKTIEEFSGVRAAKVHLAIPRESAFLKHRRKPSASVLLNMYSQKELEEEQINAIVDLVTASVPNLERARVTVTDQFGRLLHSGTKADSLSETNRELKLIRERQMEFKRKIEEILIPIVGETNFTVQVNIDMDFTKTEQTQQLFNPEEGAVRSERLLEDESLGPGAKGIPGALSNQPPAASAIPENLALLK